MAYRHQQRGEAAVLGKAEGTNRRVLGDIGNLVYVRPVEGKPKPRISRPVTRSLKAQLLRCGQAASEAVAEANVIFKPVKVDADGGGVRKGGAKAAAETATENSFKAQLLRCGQAAGEAVAEANVIFMPVKVDADGGRGVRKGGAKAAAETATENKKPLKVDADGEGGGGARKGGAKAKEKAIAKPKLPETIIEISSGTKESSNAEKGATVKLELPETIIRINSETKESVRKKVSTLTSVLTARSKAACGITGKPKEVTVHDIDSLDVDNQLAVVEYVEDIYKFYKLAENSSRIHDYMGSQTEINIKMRAILSNWLIEVHQKFELMPETLFLTIYIIDRYLSLVTISRRELQIVGVTAMLIACKYEEIWAPEIDDFICISDRAYSREQILAKEKSILNKLEWNLTVPTPYVFLVRFLKAGLADNEMEHMVFFFAELGLTQYSVMIMYCPSMIAASSVYAARCTLKKRPLWDETLRRHTGFSETQLLDCAKLLVSFHSSVLESKLRVVHNKYCSPQRGVVALHPRANSLLLKELKEVPVQVYLEKKTQARIAKLRSHV